MIVPYARIRPARAHHLHRGAQRPDRSDALDHEVGAAREHLRHGTGLRSVRRRRVVRSQFAGDRELRRRPRDPDDRPGPAVLRELEMQEPRHAEPEHDGALSGERTAPALRVDAGREHLEEGSGRGVETVRERVHVRRRECHQLTQAAVTVASEQPAFRADVRSGLPALEASAACDSGVEEDAFPGARSGRERSDDLVPHHPWVRHGDLPGVDLKIGAADADALDVHGDLIGSRRRGVPVAHLELLRTGENGGLQMFSSPRRCGPAGPLSRSVGRNRERRERCIVSVVTRVTRGR